MCGTKIARKDGGFAVTATGRRDGEGRKMAGKRFSIGIRREDKNEFERRTPLIPEHVARLTTEHGIDVVVQPSPIRAFPDEDYAQAGARVQEDLTGCDAVFAVKEIPESMFVPGKTYIYFSHTIKGQKGNMPMLRTLMQRGCQLIDYEKITDHVDRRLIFFGRHAGLVGMINTFWALGLKLAAQGIETPFLDIRQCRHYRDLPEAMEIMDYVGRRIEAEGLPDKIGPLVVGFAGYGNVSRGAQEVFDVLPFEKVAPENIDRIGQFSKALAILHSDNPNNRLYKVVFKEADMVRPRDSKYVFALQDYYDHPDRYCSRFNEYLPHLTVLVNAIYWESRYPRLVTNEYLRKAHAEGTLSLQAIGDISCDPLGAVECNTHSTDSGEPIYTVHPESGAEQVGAEGEGPVILATDNLPCELPRESSTDFSKVLVRFVPAIAEMSVAGTLEESGLPAEIQRAAVVWRGELTSRFSYLKEHVEGTVEESKPPTACGCDEEGECA